jgi:hypothetical protein
VVCFVGVGGRARFQATENKELTVYLFDSKELSGACCGKSKRAAHGDCRVQPFGISLLFQVSKVEGVTMPKFLKLNRQCL